MSRKIMTKHVLVPIADGTEEMEAVIIIDVLRRAGAEVCVASVMHEKTITASRGVNIIADSLLREQEHKIWDLIALPGGMPGAERLGKDPRLKQILEHHLAGERLLGAICAAPAVVLGRNQLINNFTATCHPQFHDELEGQVAVLSNERVVEDRFLITSQGPGTTFQFALLLAKHLFGEVKAQELARAMVVV